VEGRRILIVEDDADLRRVFRFALAVHGYNVIEAENGLHALRALELEPPDLVILDLGLPMVSGYAVLEECALQSHLRDVPVVVVTGSTVELSHANVACVLFKPVTPDRLVETVRTYLDGSAPRAGE
jgi:DNA-binding response OmpR family regulator